MFEEGACHLSKERLDDVEPGAVCRSQYVLEAVGKRCQKRSRLLGGMRGVIIHDQANRALGRIPGIQILEQSDELNAPVPFLDTGGNMSVKEVKSCQNR